MDRSYKSPQKVTRTVWLETLALIAEYDVVRWAILESGRTLMWSGDRTHAEVIGHGGKATGQIMPDTPFFDLETLEHGPVHPALFVTETGIQVWADELHDRLCDLACHDLPKKRMLC